MEFPSQEQLNVAGENYVRQMREETVAKRSLEANLALGLDLIRDVGIFDNEQTAAASAAIREQAQLAGA